MHMRFPSDHIRTISVHDFEALEPHIAAWNQLAWGGPQKVPTLLPEWTDAFLRHRVREHERWICSFVYADGELIGVLPVIISPHPILGHRKPRLSTPFDSFTPSGDIALAPDHAATALQALLVEIGHEVPGHLGLDLRAVRQNSPVWTALQAGLGDYSICEGEQFRYSVLDVRGDFTSYLAGLGHTRRNLKRFRKKLENLGTVSAEKRHGSIAGEEFLTEFMTLEASGWKGRNGTALLNSPSVTAFYRTLVSNLAARDRFEWYAIRVDDRLVAAQIAARCGESLTLLKYAFDEDFAECRLGTLLTKEVYKDAFDRPEIREINPMSLSGPDSHWRLSQDIYTDIHLVRRSGSATLLHLPGILMRVTYQKHVRPRIPNALKEARRRFQRRGDRKPRRSGNKQRSVPHA
jgi:CelD/BcsL family acetyltransferase involved in cellulose biosynthesis